MMSPALYREITRMVAAVQDETVTDEQRVRLDKLLASDPEARKIYLQYMHMDDVLPELLMGQEVSAVTDGAVALPRTPGHTWGLREFIAAVMLVLVTVLSVHLVGKVGEADERGMAEPRLPAAEPAPTPEHTIGRVPAYQHGEIAVLSRMVDVVWSERDAGEMKTGRGLHPGRLQIDAGLIQVEMFSGVSLVVEGPADIELVNSMEAICNEGRLRAFVPPPAKGFQIHTPGVDVIDWGTEFALQVNEQRKCELHVISGEVELRSQSTHTFPEDLTRLTGGQAVRYDEDGQVSEIVADLMSFIGHVRLMEMAESTYGTRYERWLSHAERLQEDPARILFYTFQDHKPWDRIVRNAGASVPEPTDGAIVGCKWTEGRWPRKGALEFKRTTDRVRIYVPGEFDSITCLAWVRIEGLETWLNSLMLTDGYELGEVHWQISNKGEIDMGVNGSINALSPSVIMPAHMGDWVHLVSVYNAGEKEVVHYFNGNPVSRHSFIKVVPLRIGAAEIGNWNPQGAGSDQLRSLNGRIDELGVFSRAFSDAEVLAIYVAGR